MIVNDEKIMLNGKELLLRVANESDALILIDFLKRVSEETKFLTKEPEEILLDEEGEKKFIKSQNESERDLMLLAFLDGEYVGNCSIMGRRLLRYKHSAALGIALFEKYTSMGIGKIMLSKLIEIAREKGLEQLDLKVSADNTRAISLYLKLGFKTYGIFPNETKYKDGTYSDTYWMMKKL